MISKLRKILMYDHDCAERKIDKQAYGYVWRKTPILDIGCGEGRFLELCDYNHSLGCDHSHKSLKICHDKGYNVVHVKLPYMNRIKTNFAGSVHLSHVIEHFTPNDALKLLQEIHRVLKPGGTLIIRTPLLTSGFYNDFTHVKPYNPQAIKRYLCGGKQLSGIAISDNYTVVAVKYRRGVLWHSENKISKLIASLLYKAGIMRRNGYMMVLKKNK